MLGLVSRAVASAAACIGCFRTGDSPYRILPAPDGDFIENQNVVSESDGELQRDDEERWNLLFDGFDIGELNDEAKFLKTWGTIPKTPVDIRKSVLAENGEGKSSGFKSLLPKASIEKLNLENEADECSRGADTSVEALSPNNSSMIEGYNPRRDSECSRNIMTPTDTNESRTLLSDDSSVSPGALHSSLQCRQKAVRFDFEPDGSRLSSERILADSSSSRSDRTGSTGYKSVYPTPLKLSDEMQTPGTIFTGYLNNRTNGEAARIRSQFVYPLPNPVEYPSYWKELNREISGFASFQELEVNGDEALASTPGMEKAGKESTSVEDIKNEPTLADQDGCVEQLGSDSNENVYHWKTAGDNRPILGFVHANSSDETSHVSSKCWGENGIPNSNTKYKEDQKVHWHETPFEKRLEKALSARTYLLYSRKLEE